MSTLVRPQLSHPIAEDLDVLALQLLSLGWVVRATADAAAEPGVLLVYAEPFGPPVGVVRLLPHHRIQLAGRRPGSQISVDDVEVLHHHLRRHADSQTKPTHHTAESRSS